MVGPSPSTDCTRTRRNRAQLILVGAVTLALIIVGLTVVLNTILFTDTVTSAVTSQDSGNAGEFDFDARRDVRSIVLRLNHRERNLTRTALASNVRRNLTNYTRLLRESYALGSPVFVNISYNDVSNGTRFVQAKDSNFKSPTGSSTWKPVDDSEIPGKPDTGWLVANLNVSNTRSDPFTIRIENRSKYVEVTIQKVNDGGVQEVRIDTERNFGGATNTTGEQCAAVRGRVLVDVLRGSSYTGNCRFNATQGMEPPFRSVQFRNGGRASGRFSLVVNKSWQNPDEINPPYKDIDKCESSDDVDDLQDPCHAPVVWQTNVTVAYGGRTVDYQRSHNVSIYP